MNIISDPRLCADCHTEYDALRGPCRHCPGLTWSVWDGLEYDRVERDRERGTYEEGFATKAAAEAAIPGIIMRLAEIGIDMEAWQFVVAPDVD